MTALGFQTATLSQVGARADNEDACGAGNGIWVVADGLGGHGGGEVAARIAVETLLGAIDPATDLGDASLIEALSAAARAIRAQQQCDPWLAGMRTTVVLLASDGVSARWAHLGDSRLYWFRGGRVVAQTLDHSVPQALVTAGALAPAALRCHEDRNRLLRTLGDDKPPRPSLGDPRALQPGDAFLLCTDGFWEAVSEAEMEIALAKAQDPAHWLSLMEWRLKARQLAGQDNYTALAIWVADQDAPR